MLVPQQKKVNTVRSVDSLAWYVFYHDQNAGEIVSFNIFEHASFKKDIKSFLAKRLDRPTFERELLRSLKYFFWSKCEWEVLISPWCGTDKDKTVKVDVCWQVMLNWDKFAEYVWEHTHRNSSS